MPDERRESMRQVIPEGHRWLFESTFTPEQQECIFDAISTFAKAERAAVWGKVIKYLNKLRESERVKSPDDRIGDGSIQTLNITVGWCCEQRALELAP